MPKIDHEFWESARFNNQTVMYYYKRLVDLSISMFEWKGLPDSVDPRFLELALFSDGFAVYFRDNDLGENGKDLCLRSMIGGRWSIYNIPTSEDVIIPELNKLFGINLPEVEPEINSNIIEDKPKKSVKSKSKKSEQIVESIEITENPAINPETAEEINNENISSADIAE